MFLGTFEIIELQVPYIVRNLVTQSTLKMVDFMNVKWHCTFLFPTKWSLFKDKLLLSDNVFPDNCEEATQMLKMLCVEYISLSCMSKCILYRGECADKEIRRQNMDMTGTINQETRVKHMFLLIR